MKRIGLITWLGGGNYGTSLQAYALYKFLSKQGYDVSLIDYFNYQHFGIKPQIKALLKWTGIFQLGHNVRIDPIYQEYDVPCWQIEFFHRGGLHDVRHRDEFVNDKRSFDDWLSFVCKEPDDAQEKSKTIIDLIDDKFSVSVQKDVNSTSKCKFT